MNAHRPFVNLPPIGEFNSGGDSSETEERLQSDSEKPEDLPANGSGNFMSDSVRKSRLLKAQAASPIATMTYSYDEGRIDLSYEAIELLGLCQNAASISFRTLIRAVAPVDRAKILVWVWDNVVSRQEPETEFSIEVRGLRGNMGGDQQWLRLEGHYAPAHPEDRVVYFTLKDITKSKRAAERQAAIHARDQRRLRDLEMLNQELSAAKQAAELSATVQARFLNVMSRDIRTPLNSLLGMLSLMDHENLSDEEAAKLRSAEHAGEQLRMLFEDLNDIAQGEIGSPKLDTGTHELAQLLKDSCSPRAAFGGETGIEIFSSVDPACPQWVEIDGSRLRQLLDRMLSQVTEAAPGKAVTITAVPARPGDLRFLVEAVGTDGHSDDLNPAQSDDLAYRQRLCDRLAESLGGRIGSSSDQGGMQLWAEIPCTASFSPKIDETHSSALLSSRGGPLRVLVAEDVLTNQIVVEGHLAQLGCECVCVSNGQEAFDAVQSGRYDVVLMDMAMPHMDGASSIRAIRNLPGGQGQLPIVALTAYSRPEELEPMLQAGANGALIKPVNLTELRDTLVAVASNS